MNPIINQLTEQQITELILLLDDQQIATAKQLLQQQLNLSEAQAETVLTEFAHLNDLTLPSSVPPSSSSDVNLNQSAFTQSSLSLAKENPIKKKRILVAIVILVLVIILGFIFG